MTRTDNPSDRMNIDKPVDSSQLTRPRVFAFVGETKAGKSTLINALLRKRILPSDVLQCSSRIVEIFRAEEEFVEVQYADGHCEKVCDDLSTPDIDEAFEHLTRIGAIQDGSRDIPTSLIDRYIIEGRIRAGSAIPWVELQKNSGLSLAGKEAELEQYVKERTLAHIPVRVGFALPLPDAFRDFRFIDTPGVNALGGVDPQLFDHLDKADVIVFVHGIENPIETASFRDFITQVVSARKEQALFLVLSKSGLKSPIEIEEKLKEARALFRKEFEPEHILHVDSMFRIVADDLISFDSASALKAHYIERRKEFQKKKDQKEHRQEWRSDAVCLHEKLQLLNHTMKSLHNHSDRDAVYSVLCQLSNFDRLEGIFNDFSL